MITYKLQLHRSNKTQGLERVARLTLDRTYELSTDRYLTLYEGIGFAYGWRSRLLISKAEVEATIWHSDRHVVLARLTSGVCGMVELFQTNDCSARIDYLGLLPSYIGQGLGSALVKSVISYCFINGMDQIDLITKSTDHPNALRTYLKAGFQLQDSWD